MKKIVVIGTGRMGGAFARAFVKRTSHAVSIRGSHAGSSSAAALSRQLACGWPTIKSFLPLILSSSRRERPDGTLYRRTHFVVYMNAKHPKPSQELRSREALAPVFADLNQYDATTHFVGQSTIFSLTGDQATGAYCLAHHVTVDSGKRRLMLASLRYYDTFVKMDGVWLFTERLLYVDWVDERPLS